MPPRLGFKTSNLALSEELAADYSDIHNKQTNT